MNESKIRDPRMWEKWRRSGAVRAESSQLDAAKEISLRALVAKDEDVRSKSNQLDAENEIRAESLRLLGGKDEDVRRDSNDHALILVSKEHLEKTIFKGADFAIDRYRFNYGHGVTFSTQELYVFYPDGVLKIVRCSSESDNQRVASRMLQPERRSNVNTNELGELLQTVKKSTQFKSSFSI